MPKLRDVLDHKGRVIEVVDLDDCCNTYDSPPCGGCGHCLYQQAVHSGFQVRVHVPPKSKSQLDFDRRVQLALKSLKRPIPKKKETKVK